MNTLTPCPILQDTQQIQGLSHDLTKSIRKLRRDLRKCQSCPSFEDCPTLKEFNSIVDAAILATPARWMARKMGFRELVDFDELGIQVPFIGVSTLKATVKKSPGRS